MTTPDVGGGFGIKGFNYPGVLRRRLRRARARAAGALDERPRRGHADRQPRPRPRDGGRGGVRRRLPAAGAPHRLRLEPRRLQQPVRPAHRLGAGAEGHAGRLRRAEGVLLGEGRLHQHDADRRLPRGGPAGGDLRDRAADGLVGARPRARPGGAAAAQLHPARPLSLPDRVGRDLRRGRLRPGARPGDRGGGRGGLRGAQGGERPRRAAARHRAQLLHRSILGAQNETTTIAFAEDGMVELCVGTQSNGQGHETAFAQILAERSGIPVRAHPLRAGRLRPHRHRGRHRRVAVGDDAGQLDQPRDRRGDLPLPPAGGGGAGGGGRRPGVRGGRVPGGRHRPGGRR